MSRAMLKPASHLLDKLLSFIHDFHDSFSDSLLSRFDNGIPPEIIPIDHKI